MVIGTGPSSVDAEIDGSAPSKAFASAVVNLAAVEFWLRDGLVAPIVAWDCQSPMSLAKCLMSFVFIWTSGIEE